MTFLIAAAGTGGHVFPGLAVGEALVDLGVPRADVLYVGAERLESSVYPEEGFPFLHVEIRGFRRSLTPKNLGLPALVLRARKAIGRAITERSVKVALGMGGYITIPAGMAAAKAGITFMLAEQNAEAGMANKIAARWASRQFGSFPQTIGLNAEWVGNPVREMFWSFERGSLRDQARNRYQLDAAVPTLGVFGGSLGARALNEAVVGCLTGWDGPEMAVIHLTGELHLADLAQQKAAGPVEWRRVAFEDSMELFYAASDLVLARAGGGVAELTATNTPAVLVPGSFGSAGHQAGNARHLATAGAAIVLAESELGHLSDVVKDTLFDASALEAMRYASQEIAKPRAAHTIAAAMLEVAT